MVDDHGAAEDGVHEQLAVVIERAQLNDTEAGRRLAAAFVELFGGYMRDEVRPVLRAVAAEGSEPQLVVNGVAELLRATADSIEFPLDHPRAGSPNRTETA